MAEYSRGQFKQNIDSDLMDVVHGDMRFLSACLPDEYKKEYFAVITLLLKSVERLLTHKDCINMLQSVYQTLKFGGLFFVELEHPSDLFSGKYMHLNFKKMKFDEIMRQAHDNHYKYMKIEATDLFSIYRVMKLRPQGFEVTFYPLGKGAKSEQYYFRWGSIRDKFDLETQIMHRTIQFRKTYGYHDDPEESTPLVEFSEVVPYKLYTAPEFKALAASCGFSFVGSDWFGWFNEATGIHYCPTLLLILRRDA